MKIIEHKYNKQNIIDNKYDKAYSAQKYETDLYKLKTPAKLDELINSIIEKHTWSLPYVIFLKKKDQRIYAVLNAYQHDTLLEVTQKIIDVILTHPIYKLYINDTNTHQNLTIRNAKSFEINLHDEYDNWEHVRDISEIHESHEKLFLFDDLEFELYPENEETTNLILNLDENIIDLTIRLLPTYKQKLQMQITIPNMMQLLHLHLGFIDHYIYKILIYLQEYIHPRAKITLDNLVCISKELIKLQLPHVSLDIFLSHSRPNGFYLHTEALIRSSFGIVDICEKITTNEHIEYKEPRLTGFQDMINISVKRPPMTIKFSGDNIEGIEGDVRILALKAETSHKNLFKKDIDEFTTTYSNEITITKEGSNITSGLSFSIDTKIYKKIRNKKYNTDSDDSEESSNSEDGNSIKKIKM